MNAQCTPGDLDSDADGLCDIEDLDDDNDGILDEKETVCSVLLSDLSFYGDGIDNTNANTINLTNNGGWRTSYSNDTLSLPVHLEFRADISTHRMIGFLPLGATETTSWNDAAYKLYVKQDNNLYGKLTNQWTFTMIGVDTKFLELDIDETGRLTVMMDGTIIYSGIAPINDYRLAVSSYSGGTIEEFALTYRKPSCNTQDIDTDGDNIPNRLDLDSDGDLCVDAFEGDANFGLNDMDGNGRLLGGVDSNGVPIAAGIPGQGLGESTIAHSPLIDFRECMCIASNNPTDADNDGVCDAIDICDNVPDNLIGTSCNDGDNTTINDVWTSACACAGTPTCVSGALDTDADGVCDIEDKDDDNDGILDENEIVCSISLSNLSFYGDAIESIQPDKILLNSVGWRTSYSNDIFSLPFHLEFLANNSHDKMIGFLPLGYVERTAASDDSAYKLYTHTNGLLYGKLPNQWTFSTPNVDGKLVEMDIDINGNLSVKLDGNQVYAGMAPISDYRLAISSNDGGSLEDLVIAYGQIPCILQDLDTDGDGTPNRLDLDSDNDRCVDAFEGDAGFGLNDMDADGRLTGGVDSDGIPIVAGASGQGVGQSTIPYTPLIDTRECICIPSNNPTDSDNDGICDDVDVCDNLPDNLIGTSCDDGDNTTVDDTWLTNCECVGETPCMPGDLDSDNDGICDARDRDDDNDGIPDEKETNCTTLLSDLSMYGDAINFINADSIDLTANNAWRGSYSNDTLTLPIHLEFRANIGTLKMIGFLPLGDAEVTSDWTDAAYKLYVHTNNRLYAKLPNAWTFNSSGVNGQLVEMDIDISGNTIIKIGGAVAYTGAAPLSDYRLVVNSHNGGTFNEILLTHGLNTSCFTSDIDTDKDGIPNRLDLDSDGDMCVDAFEGDAGFGLNDMDGDGRLTGAVGTNSGSPTYGVPLSAGNGQEVGESLEAYLPVIDTRECRCIASNNPTDSDADGVCDAIDRCPNMSDALIGTPCDDGEVCTINDVWTTCCECKGTLADSDGDQICDVLDNCPNFDNAIDMDDDNIPDCQDTCIDVNENGDCDNVEAGFSAPELSLYADRRRGYYEQPFALQLLSNDPNATIRYTTNGTPPTPSTGTIYNAAIPINTTSFIRALAYTPNDTTKVITHTYLFVNDVMNQSGVPSGHPAIWSGIPADYDMDPEITQDPAYAPLMRDALLQIPSVSIVIERDSFFGENGIYLNTQEEGVLWERPTSIELLDPTGKEEGFQENAGVRIQGGASRVPYKSPKHSLRILFKGIYGDTKLRYPLFGESGVDKFDTFVLRARFNNSWIHWSEAQRQSAQYLRELFMQQAQMDMGNFEVDRRHVHLYINGMYWGLHLLNERPNASFMAEHLGGDKEDYDALNSGEVVDGDLVAWDTMMTLANAGLANNADYLAIQDYLDVDNLIDFMMVNHWGGNTDWDHHNWYAGRERKPGAGYKFFVWDAEGVIHSTSTNRVNLDYANKPSRIFQKLRENEDFRMRFADRLQCHFFNNGALTVNANLDRWNDGYEKIDKAIVAESARWGDYRRDVDPRGCSCAFFDVNEEYLTERNRILTEYFPFRNDTVIQQYRDENLYPTIDGVQFSQYGGVVSSGFQITLSNPNNTGTIYYTTDGTDPRTSGGGISASAQVYSGSILLPDGVTDIKARILDGTTWSAMCPPRFYANVDYNDLVINEIMYHADDTCSQYFDELDYIEIYNTGTKTVNLADTKFTSGIDYKFDINAQIAPGGYLILAENKDTFNLHYGFMPHDQYGGGLDNDGEKLVYKDFLSNTIDSVKYNDKNPWDERPDGDGPSLELLDPTSDNADPISWFRSDDICGTPGVANSRVCTGVVQNIIINEINYNSNNGITDPGDWVELHNPNTVPVDISDWSFYDNGNEFIFPAGTTIQPDEYLVLVEDATAFTGIFPHLTANDYIGDFSFGLSNKGERISLFNKNKCLSDYVVYNDRIPWDTIPDGNGPTLSLIIPDVDNALPQSWESSSDINSAYGTPGRENTPCPENIIVLPTPICTGFPAQIKVDSAYSDMGFTWFASGATPFNFTTDSETLTWNNSGNYNLQLITKYYECTKVYTKPITITDCNTAPNLVNDIFSVNEDNVLSNNVLTNDNDPENNNLTVNITPQSPTSNGTLILNPDGTFDYTPNLNFNGTDSFTYEACDDAQTLVSTNVPITFTTQVASGADDVEELSTDGSISIGSSDLDLLNDPPNLFAAVGIRMTNISIPQGAVITDAYLEFVADESQSITTAIDISAEAVGNALPIPTTAYSVSSKPRTSAAASWTSMSPWTTGDTYRSADIGAVVQELINRGDWSSGNAMTFILEGTGTRTAESFEGAVAPKLVINYQAESQSSTDVSLCNTATVTIIVEPDCVDIELFAWLEGAYDPALGEMRTTLVDTRKLLPGQTPVSNLATPTPAGQPYSIAPWNYTGTEGAGWTNADYTNNETDWVLVSFRTGTAKSTEVGMTAALLMKDGSITFPDRCALTSTVASPLYIVLEHRNHIGIMTPQPVNLIGSTLTYDFRLADSFRDPTSFGQKLLPTGEWTMFAGDANQLDFPSFDINGTDKTIWFDNNGVFDYYFSPDFNLDGDINGQDKTLWFDNNGISSRVPK